MAIGAQEPKPGSVSFHQVMGFGRCVPPKQASANPRSEMSQGVLLGGTESNDYEVESGAKCAWHRRPPSGVRTLPASGDVPLSHFFKFGLSRSPVQLLKASHQMPGRIAWHSAAAKQEFIVCA